MGAGIKNSFVTKAPERDFQLRTMQMKISFRAVGAGVKKRNWNQETELE
ncbi:MAG: hypothetical protein NC548_23070 [Lachnospiraceae bacterium]|nr:hypothetical protein [Lachnospiraceae bacterium]